jgi:hypothetical protein
MKKTYCRLLSVLMVLFMILPLTAIPVNAWGECRLAYTIENGEVTITGSNDPIDDVITIPETIEGYPVTAIEHGAFFRKSTIHSITIPSTITRIGQDAFYFCESLENVYISDLSAWCKIEFDGSRATPMYYASNLYLNNELLTDVTIPEDITQLADFTFHSCESLTSVTVPKTATEIGYYSLSKCTNLSNITLPDGLKRIDECAFLGCTALEEITIPESVTEIGDHAFAACGLTTFTVPESITEIGYGMFASCTNLTTINIHDDVNKIGAVAFSRCSSLPNITIPDSVTEIGGRAFAECSSLTTITIPDGVTEIRDYLFADCVSLATITLSDTVTSIGFGAFDSCNSLTSITIPKGVNEVWPGAFQNCTSLTSITFLGSAPEFAHDCFEKVIANVYYPSADETWTDEVKQDYWGTLTWIGYEPEVPTLIVGDVTGNGQVNMGDVSSLYAHIRGVSLIKARSAQEVADINGDGNVNMGDVSSLYAQVRGTV